MVDSGRLTCKIGELGFPNRLCTGKHAFGARNDVKNGCFVWCVKI